MIIYFVEVEASEEAYFRQELAGHEARFVDDLSEVGEDAEIVSSFIYSEINREFVEGHPRLRGIATRSGTVEHVDMRVCAERNIAVSLVPNYGDTTVAEHTFALILALSRRLRENMAASQDTKRFSYRAARGFDLQGKTLGVIGMGPIAQRVTVLAHAFQMRLIAFDPHGMPAELAPRLGFEWASRDELLRNAHVVSLHTRLSPLSLHILNRETLALCRPGVLIVNTARGRLIDTAALAEALESGRVGGAGLDVLEEERVMREPITRIIADEIVQHLRSDTGPGAEEQGSRLHSLHKLVESDSLLARKNVVFTPHIAFNSVEAVQRLNETTVENIRAITAGEPRNLAVLREPLGAEV